jgi:hypothetical protein
MTFNGEILQYEICFQFVIIGAFGFQVQNKGKNSPDPPPFKEFRFPQRPALLYNLHTMKPSPQAPTSEAADGIELVGNELTQKGQLLHTFSSSELPNTKG